MTEQSGKHTCSASIVRLSIHTTCIRLGHEYHVAAGAGDAFEYLRLLSTEYLTRLSIPEPGSVAANVFHSPISHFTHLTPYLPKHYTEEWVHDMRR